MYRLIETILFFQKNINKNKLHTALTGKSILITGASSGIGEQVAYQLADIPCQLILVARRGERLAEIKEKIEPKGAKVTFFQGDLRDEAEMKRFLTFLHDLPTDLDFVVNNAGLSIKRSLYESFDRYHDFTRTMAINYFAPVQLLLSLIPVLEKQRGHIINVSTVNALLAPVPYFSAYQASKSAFDVWLRSAQPELKSQGISVTSIYLPLVRTPMIEPTAAYRNIPAMISSDAARIICKSMYTKKKRYQPWWLIFGQLVSIFLTSFWDMSKNNRRK
ncbi:SDR family NAD(P)-dependent oxidoreductase [Evansella sp. AB-rgal1]|uniref:SDR family NAD(P)-dependent oxidoreductase n=1 Tax=Evansella sp. AB-rgal1 TaxID=3242696 RepID=UPI00359CC455